MAACLAASSAACAVAVASMDAILASTVASISGGSPPHPTRAAIAALAAKIKTHALASGFTGNPLEAMDAGTSLAVRIYCNYVACVMGSISDVMQGPPPKIPQPPT